MAGLADRRDALTRQLSGGWKQRLALGCAILHDPPVLFLDEPTSGVDPHRARRVLGPDLRLCRRPGTPIFVSTHYMDEAEYCHRLALMYRGKVIALGSPAELKAGLRSAQPAAAWSPRTRWNHARAGRRCRESATSRCSAAGLHLTVDDAAATGARVRERLAGAGHRGAQAGSRSQPSMEDVFVALIEAEERKAA